MTAIVFLYLLNGASFLAGIWWGRRSLLREIERGR